MMPPVENVIAAFPPSFAAGNVTLRPLTVGGAIRLAEIGVDVTKTPVPKDRLFAAAFVLNGKWKVENGECSDHYPLSIFNSPLYKRFLRHAKCGLKELSSAVEAALNAAFATRIPPMEDSRAPAQLTPSGLGWPLELAEWLCAEYGWRFAEVTELPLSTAFALQAAARIRHGGKHGGPDYIERTLDIVKNSTH